ncbi:trypsin/alpha-amylase inhibitor CMX1/CMX3-like [Aegilops tauschii subsp. strangulata]|uniref:Bifunctional inhibitor/plant lipid transfer protein/seed storage helical domain-containing protein n=3 Tax=Triticinae TaxID=1648030 RepID=A0A453IN69_AEGTS|nr:trypsin/alpha-amylase inhibitor CMX1/CMX3-like [Aegilops tauschii subsp. strangulata]
MAFKHQLILSTAILLAVLAAASASFREQCVPGREITYESLNACAEYAVRQTCGYYLSAEREKRRCCDELSKVPKFCRCEVLHILMDGRVTKEGVVKGSLLQEDMSRCKKLTREFIAGIVGREECNLETVLGPYHYCPTEYPEVVV